MQSMKSDGKSSVELQYEAKDKLTGLCYKPNYILIGHFGHVAIAHRKLSQDFLYVFADRTPAAIANSVLAHCADPVRFIRFT